MKQNGLIKVAIAGTGNVAQYMIEEIQAYGHEVIVLTRREKPEEKRFEQRQTDYSVPSLVAVLKGIDVLVSTITDYSDPSISTKITLDMLEACRQSEKCKTFIPSEWTLNVEDYPEQPMFLAEANKALHHALTEEKTIKWTIICCSWFADYVVTKQNRHLRDIDTVWPMDHSNKIFTIYGPGTQLVDLTPVRDVAKAVAALIGSKEPWGEYTYVSGEQLTWNDLFAIVKKRDPAWTSRNKSLADTVNQIVANESPEAVFVAHFELQSYAGALALPKEKVQRDRAKHFSGVHFRTVEEVLDAATARPNEII